jgi:hypothetical protein
VAARNRVTTRGDQESSELIGGWFTPSLIASDASIEAALEPLKLIEGIGQAGSDVNSRFAVQTLCPD